MKLSLEISLRFIEHYCFESKIVKKVKVIQSTYCYCPKCRKDLISSGSFVSDEDLLTYKCTLCNQVSEWYFDCPVPILISPEPNWDEFQSRDKIKLVEESSCVKFTVWQQIYLKCLNVLLTLKKLI